MPVRILLAGILFYALLSGCGNNLTPEQKEYVDTIEKFREEKNDYMKNDPSSPFSQDPGADYSPLKYYDVDPRFVFKSRLYEYDPKDTITVLGTKGEERKVVRFGYVVLVMEGNDIRLNVYKGTSRNGQEYYSIWFTDETTGDETYGVGRYIDFEYVPDSVHIYTIDFNLAYNPYCAYSSKYSCAIPTRDDHLAVRIKAGEKNFH